MRSGGYWKFTGSKLSVTSSEEKNLCEFIQHRGIPSGPRSPKVDILHRPEDSYSG